MPRLHLLDVLDGVVEAAEAAAVPLKAARRTVPRVYLLDVLDGAVEAAEAAAEAPLDLPRSPPRVTGGMRHCLLKSFRPSAVRGPG